MPKTSKKKKEKTADFTKAKLKLGKGKRVASNAVDTSFKARSIALPQQSITVEKDTSTPTTKRKLTLSDLLGHFKHHNAGVRRDAMQGLRELFQAYPELIEPNLTNLLNACVRLIGDEDASVRKGLLQFFSWFLPRVPSIQILPHAPLLLLFTTSAQTHIFPEIRIDAIRFLDLLLDVIPDQVVNGWTQSGDIRSSHGSRVLDGYLGLLNVGSRFVDDGGPVKATSTASVVLSPTSKAVVFNSLSAFLRHVTSREASTSTASSTPTWYLSSSFSSPESYESFVGLLRPSRTSPSGNKYTFRWAPEADNGAPEEDFAGHFHLVHETSDEGLQDLSRVVADIAHLADADPSLDSEGANISRVMSLLCRTLHPILISVFLDCAPTVFSPTSGPPETDLQLIVSVGQITRCLYNTLLTNNNMTKQSKECAFEDLKSMLSHMAPYFPFGENGLVSQNMKTELAFQELNLVFCELSSLFVLVPQVSNGESKGDSRIARPPRSRKSNITSTPATLVKQVALISVYVVRSLRGEVKTVSHPLGQTLTPAMYIALLPTLWSLVNDTTAASTSVLDAILEHSTHISSTSAVKMPSIQFVGQLILLQSDHRYKGSFRLGHGRPEDTKVLEWVVHLPKTLWELGDSHLTTTEIILLFFLRLFQRSSWLINQESIAAISARLVPFFIVQHKTRGELPGPYSKLPVTSPLRHLVIDVVITLCALSSASEELRAAVEKAVTGTDDLTYWRGVSSR